MAKICETALYAPVKAMLEGQGYVVKGEVTGADLVACRGTEPPLIVELKTGFKLALFHQAVARQAVSDAVYIAVPRGAGRRFGDSLKDNLALARRLGLGVITVRLSDGFVEVHCDPAPYRPRQSPRLRARLLREFARREGDPTPGGLARGKVMTAYRQDALRLARSLACEGPSKGAEVAARTGIARATRMMADDHYGWFERVARGTYGLTPRGLAALPPDSPSDPGSAEPSICASGDQSNQQKARLEFRTDAG